MNSMNYEVIDNFLPIEEFRKLKDMIFFWEFPWNWNDYQLPLEKDRVPDSPFFSHTLYDDNKPVSPYYDAFNYFLNSLPNWNRVLLNLRLNLTTNSYGNAFNHKHKDTDFLIGTIKTAIFYFNNCNGKTVLCNESDNEEIEIDSVENRILLFNSEILHYSKHATDVDRRVVLNLNYI